MHLMKYTDGWTRRHFLEQTAKGIFAAGVLAPLWDVIDRTGSCEAAYPPELLSIEAYTKGKLKVGDELNADNVDIVKDILDPGAYWMIKNDGRRCILAPTETDMTKLLPASYLNATLKNRGKHKIFPDGNCYTLEGKPWIGGNPFPEPQNAQEALMGLTLSWDKYDSFSIAMVDCDTDPDGYIEYKYEIFVAMWQYVGRTDLDPKPYHTGHEHQLRTLGMLVVAPEDLRGTAFLQNWGYDQHLFPDFYGYTPLLKRVRTFPTDQRFEPQLPGDVWFATEAWSSGDPLLTWGDFKLVGKGPLLCAYHHCGDLDRPNWEHQTCGGKSGTKYYWTKMALLPEAWVIELKPTGYPRCPIGKKWLWMTPGTGVPLPLLLYDRQGKVWQSYEGGFDQYVRKPGMKWIAGVPDNFWQWTTCNVIDLQSRRATHFQILQEITGGYHTTCNDPKVFDEYCSITALRRLGR